MENSKHGNKWKLLNKGYNLWLGQFESMASPCEIWLECERHKALELISWAVDKALEVEHKYSRFLPNSLLTQINNNSGHNQKIDKQTQGLLEFAHNCWELSDGMLDITIGGYLRHWKFDGKSLPPTKQTIKKEAKTVGWDKVLLKEDNLLLPKGMTLDLGGICKEYTVDLIAIYLSQKISGGVMVNFGGDLMSPRSKTDNSPWIIGIESQKSKSTIISSIPLLQGAIATSGNNKRYAVDNKKKKLGHILNPLTGMPVSDSPASVTVLAQTATQAGILSTYAMLQGSKAKQFLKKEKVHFFLQKNDC